ncbi:EamA/RhaT family transporter [Cupriavidus necator]|uniref:EamA/RhaT family transporter n=1 Tax=Cupriavidus necator TaxID=106590 RepID=A0A1U9UXI9_CUPNE|nr:DMT family transporter [Cupriavidus necator]AQV97289.1 EamA/RhaT family transporter [Cupriavidus necator]
MPHANTVLLTVLAMLAFAGNSLLCRLALKGTTIDAGTFTLARVAAAAAVLWLIVMARRQVSRAGVRGISLGGNWVSALALFCYAAAFSFAYERLSAGTGALLLFAAVQATMVGYGLYAGELLRAPQWSGLALALAGLVWLMLPSLATPPLVSSLLMIAAGIAWGVYSLRGKRAADPVETTAGNFVRAVPMALALGAAIHAQRSLDGVGLAYAVLSGAITSGLGYVIWYTAVPQLRAATAATVQLSVPVITAAGGIALLGEALTLRLALSAAAVLGGIALVITGKRDEVGQRTVDHRGAGGTHE